MGYPSLPPHIWKPSLVQRLTNDTCYYGSNIPSANSFNSHVGISSGPDALTGLRFFSRLYTFTPVSVTISGSCGEPGTRGPLISIFSMSGLSNVNREQNCWLSISALVVGREWNWFPFRSGDTPLLSCLWLQKEWFLVILLQVSIQHAIQVLPV